MISEFIPPAEAQALKELGFNEPCLKHYTHDGWLKFNVNEWGQPASQSEQGPTLGETPAPLYQQAFRWFREKYELNKVIVKAESWFHTINGCNTQEGFQTYEEAELNCLRELIRLSGE